MNSYLQWRSNIVTLLIAAALAIAPVSATIAQEAAIEAPPAAAPLALADVFSDGMVLQRGMEIPVWGTAQPGAMVSVQLAGEEHEATADEAGNWRVRVGPLSVGQPLEMHVAVVDDNRIINDILVGEVWIASGQSNMEWPLRNTDDGDQAVAAADWPQIRLLDVEHHVSRETVDLLRTDGWKPCRPDTAGDFSAVAYYFGRELHEALGVPIGLIGCNWGGTIMEAWTSREALESSSTFAPVVEEADRRASDPDARINRPQNEPAALFNGMLNPLVGYGIRGVIWYQGESNAGRYAQYRELSELMIGDWRSRWGQGEFPFLLVQLAAWQPGGDNWPYLREAQLQTLELPNTGMAVAIDIGHPTDIHPRNKLDVGRRLALAARAIAYGEDVVYSGPMYHNVEFDGGKAYLTFDHVGSGLEQLGDKLLGFEICEDDREFVPADARIDGDRVVVWDHKVRAPAAVRYNWSAYPDGNLYNAEGLPATPFRTDDF